MAVPTLPDALKNGLLALTTLSEEDFNKFVGSLKALPVEIKQHRVFPDFKVDYLPDKGESLKSAVFSLALTRVQRGGTTAEMAHELTKELTNLGLTEEMVGTLRHRAKKILDVESLHLIAKAHSVLLEHSCTYSSARIVSDIRTVFGDDISSQPEAAVIVHMLNIVYFNARRREISSIAMDEKDIDQLIAVLERARTKSKSLRETIEKSGVKYVGVK